MDIAKQQLTEDVPAGPGFGLKRPAFGLAREPINRLEVVLAIRGGGLLNVFVELTEEVTAERLDDYAQQLAADIQAGNTRSFTDAWSATGQRAWVNLGEVAAFSVRQAK